MKNPQANLSDDKARKELRLFLAAGWALAFVALFAFGLIAVGSLIFGARCLVLSWHKGNANAPHGMRLKVASVVLVALSALELVIIYAAPKG